MVHDPGSIISCLTMTTFEIQTFWLIVDFFFIWLFFASLFDSSEEMIEMQGVPIVDDALFACGVDRLFDHSAVSASSLRKMAGNSFSQPCMSAFLAFTLAHLKPNSFTQIP